MDETVLHEVILATVCINVILGILGRANNGSCYNAITIRPEVVFFIFRFTDPPDPILFLYRSIPPTPASTILEFNYVFSFCPFLIELRIIFIRTIFQLN